MIRIEEVVRLTGISKQALHAWERRYGALSTARTPSNRRLFSDSDLTRLMLLKKCIDKGHRIGSIFHLDTQELQELLGDATSGKYDDILMRVRSLDKDAVNAILVDRMLLLGPASFAVDYVTPLMHTVGRLWQSGELSIAAEHLLSGSVRSLLGTALKPGRNVEPAMSVLFCTPEGDIHELGTLVAAVLAQEAGWRVFYFGAQLPIEVICETARQLDTGAVCVGSTWLGGSELAAWTAALDGQLPDHVKIWAGGAGFASIDNRLPARVRLFSGLTEFELFLQLKDQTLA